MAEQVTLVELQRFSFIGAEEFVQTLGKEDLKTGVGHCDCVNRKTKNLEAYVRWFQRLTYYVASEICKMSKKKSRCRVCGYWVQVAKECLNIRLTLKFPNGYPGWAQHPSCCSTEKDGNDKDNDNVGFQNKE